MHLSDMSQPIRLNLPYKPMMAPREQNPTQKTRKKTKEVGTGVCNRDGD